jgi:uncharacterized protein
MLARRVFLKTVGGAAAALHAAKTGDKPLEEFGYRNVELAPGPAQTQFEQTQAVLLSLNEDGLLKPWRLRAGLPAPGPDLGGWYDELPLHKTESGGHGFAPAHCFGQWLSALARGYAIDRSSATRAHLVRLLDLYQAAISPKFYSNFRFPAYNYDKMVIALIDAHQFADIPQAYDLLERTTNAAEPHLPPTALDRDEPQRRWRQSMGESTGSDYTWDESYTLPENLFLAASRGAGERYQKLAQRFLLDKTYFDPLAAGQNVLADHHAYSFCNALSSAMQAYLALGSTKHLRAASNAFDMISRGQSFATGGWGPNESFLADGSDGLYKSLEDTHRGFETPCGSYAHFKLTRYLLRVTRDGRYGDSMERVFYNTVLGAKPLEENGRAFYYSDYHSSTRKSYFPDPWPCCSGTLPQVTADYRILCYFRDPEGVWVNLYLPSTLRWTTAEGSQVTLTQSGSYPLGENVSIRFQTAKPSQFALRLRLPQWNAGIRLAINGQPVTIATRSGFATVRRTWKDGDKLDLTISMPFRLEPISPQHPETVALVYGPLVLFSLNDRPQPFSREQLIAARKSPHEPLWQVNAGGRISKFQPFYCLTDEVYSTYLKLT